MIIVNHPIGYAFMIVLKDDSLSTVWEEFESLLKLLPKNSYEMKWGVRRQTSKWVNNIEYYFGANECNKMIVHVVTCDELWEVVDEKGDIVPKHSHHAWISSRSLNRNNLHERCNLGARHRWAISKRYRLGDRGLYIGGKTSGLPLRTLLRIGLAGNERLSLPDAPSSAFFIHQTSLVPKYPLIQF